MAMNPKAPEEKKLNINTVTFGDLTWVDIVDPGEDVRQYLENRFGFNPMDLDDYFSLRQLSKVDEYQSYLSIIFHLPTYDKKARVSTIFQWAAFVGDKYLVTLHPGLMRSLGDVREECEASEAARKENMGQGSAFLLYNILDRAVDSYFPVMDKIISLIDDVEDTVFDEETDAAKEISILRRDILTQRRVMFPLRALLKELESKLKRFAKTDMTVFYGDLLDHMSKICDSLDEGKETIEVFKDADYTLSGYRANRVIRIMSIMLATALPFLVVASLFSMRIPLPGGIDTGSPNVFYVLLAAAALVAGVGLYALRRRRLI
jgi:magnesium transporter